MPQAAEHEPALLARFPHDRDHFGVAGERLDERHRAVRPEAAAEPDLLFRRQCLLAEEDHLVIEQRPPDLGDHVVIEYAGEVDAGHDRAARAGNSIDGDVPVLVPGRRRGHRDQRDIGRRHRADGTRLR